MESMKNLDLTIFWDLKIAILEKNNLVIFFVKLFELNFHINVSQNL